MDLTESQIKMLKIAEKKAAEKAPAKAAEKDEKRLL